ncbi:MAG: type I glyceraldehyde-3-phosphate dehydrogenase [Planctomycetota bacterium]|jgi:glyceraldehyde 3-phosphate dehydrogenase
MKRILVNGFGRVGRALFRILEHNGGPKVTHINDPLPIGQLAYLLEYDSVMGRFDGEISIDKFTLIANGRRIRVSHATTLGAPEVDGSEFVVNSSGRNNERSNLEHILESGAKRVFVSHPLPEGIADRTILRGINNNDLQEEDRIISAGSCTAHCFAPPLKAIHARWPILRGYMMTVHAYTSAQNIVDGGHEKDPRRGRAGAQNIVPTTTASLSAFEQAVPELAGRLTGMAQRVPVVNGSNVELVLELQGSVSREEINSAMKVSAEDEYKGILEYTDAPVVSSDIIGNSHSSIYDSLLTHTQPGETTLARVYLWYDNEWGYTNRLAELIR